MLLPKLKTLDFKKAEVFYFYFFVALNLLPVLVCKFFPTSDGPSHLYNSSIILELIRNANSPFHQFFSLNSHLNPNSSGHFLLAFLLILAPSFAAEKIVLLIYLIGLPLSIRFVFKYLPIKSKYLLYAVFPFTYSFLFYYGFYNFNIGLFFFFGELDSGLNITINSHR